MGFTELVNMNFNYKNTSLASKDINYQADVPAFTELILFYMIFMIILTVLSDLLT